MRISSSRPDQKSQAMENESGAQLKSWRPKPMAQEIPVLDWGTAVRKEKQMSST
jgi:hypothetical protein